MQQYSSNKTINYYVEYYLSSFKERQQEIDYVLNHNSQLNFLSNIFIFCNDEAQNQCKRIIRNSSKAHIIPIQNRLTFSQTFNFANSVSQEQYYNITSNNDILLTDTINNLSMLSTDFYCISRYENINDKTPTENSYVSQDTWVWLGHNKIHHANFFYGLWGCDWRLGFLALDAGYILCNPSLTYKTIHYHKSNIRSETNNANNCIEPCEKLYLNPCKSN